MKCRSWWKPVPGSRRSRTEILWKSSCCVAFANTLQWCCMLMPVRERGGLQICEDVLALNCLKNSLEERNASKPTSQNYLKTRPLPISVLHCEIAVIITKLIQLKMAKHVGKDLKLNLLQFSFSSDCIWASSFPFWSSWSFPRIISDNTLQWSSGSRPGRTGLGAAWFSGNVPARGGEVERDLFKAFPNALCGSLIHIPNSGSPVKYLH